MGPLPPASFVRDEVDELYDYEALRRLDRATLIRGTVQQPTVVLGSNQDVAILNSDRVALMAVRRRRGGGGVVLLRPGDVWIDYWIPHNDSRWRSDIHQMSGTVGEWWRRALDSRGRLGLWVHGPTLEGAPELRVACFAGAGPGEVFLGNRKVVGITQWRVREGAFISGVVHRHSSVELVDMLRDAPEGLGEALDHHTLESSGVGPVGPVIDSLRHSGDWAERQHLI
jgi:lipoate---protein ligase